jgi:hypothetical protein
MLAVISWQCDCGTHVKVMYETEGVSTLRCPNGFCNCTRIVTGRVTSIWEDNGGGWQVRDVAKFILPASDSSV